MTDRAEQPDGGRRLDRDRYPWQFTVRNRFELERPLGFGTTINSQGEPVGIGVGPDYWTFAWQGVCQRLEDEHARLREQQEKPES